MNIKISRVFLFCLAGALFLMLWGCSRGEPVAGTGINTGNTITGVVLDSEENTVEGVLVRLYPADFNPVEPDTTVKIPESQTDGDGEFEFTDVARGTYNLLASHLDTDKKGLREDFEVDSDDFEGSVTLKLYKPINVSFPTVFAVSSGSYAYIPGTNIFTRQPSTISATDPGKIEGVPPGDIRVINWLTNLDSVPQNILVEPVILSAGKDTLLHPKVIWPYAARAEVSGQNNAQLEGVSLTNVPVYIRLSPDNFNFSGHIKDGSDLEFAFGSTRPGLGYVDFYNPSASEAGIWLGMETILANASEKLMDLYWGRGLGVQSASLDEIFTSDNIQVYWRFSGLEGDAAGATLFPEIKATADVLEQNTGILQAGEGVLGGGLTVNSNSLGIISTESFAPSDVFNISFWFKTYDTGGSAIAGFSSHPDRSSQFYYDRGIWMDTEGAIVFGVFEKVTGEVSPQDSLEIKYGGDPAIWPAIEREIKSGPGYNDNQWHYVVCQLSEAGQAIYIDGNEQVRDPDVISAAQFSGHWILASRYGLEWGVIPDRTGYKGLLDELKVETGAREENWIRFMYENQKPESRLVELK